MHFPSDFSNIQLSNADRFATLRAMQIEPPAFDRSATGIEVKDEAELKEAFQDFVGQTFFGQMIASMRATQHETPYFNGGRAEKIFQGQLDQVLSEELSDASASQFADPMYQLFQLQRK